VRLRESIELSSDSAQHLLDQLEISPRRSVSRIDAEHLGFGIDLVRQCAGAPRHRLERRRDRKSRRRETLDRPLEDDLRLHSYCWPC